MNRFPFAACILAALLPVSALARPTDLTATTVELSDLDLTQPEGMRIAEKRIERTARRLCAAHAMRGVQLQKAGTTCESEATRLAVMDVKRTAKLAARARTQLHASR